MSEAPGTPEAIRVAWQAAQEVWDMRVTLSPPEPLGRAKGSSHWQGDEPLAYIDMEKRQVVVNLPLLEKLGAGDSLTAVLAHEIGHHVRFPHTLGLAASLSVLEKRLIPGLGSSLLNLFFDLLVNEHVGRTRRDELIAVYRGFVAQAGGGLDPLFAYYLALYEELWGQEPGTLLPAAVEEAMETQHPGFRSDARVFVQTFYALTRIHSQFVYFCSQFIRYIPDPSKLAFRIPLGHDLPMPGPDDFDGVVRGYGEDETDDALREARENGWLKESGLVEGKEEDPLATIDRITQHMPGHGQAAFRQALVSRHYKRLVDQYILKLPAPPGPREPVLPSVLEDWEWGDNPASIDWTGSVVTQGPLASLRPQRRDLLPDEPPPEEDSFPAVEIYLDTSGSMPNPAQSLNAMTLAAQILAASAIRKQGLVRGIVYSSGKPLLSDWMREEETARLFLLNYAGGGTDYPFPLLKRLSAERPDAIRVVISDSDFLYNASPAGAMDALAYGIEHSRLLVAFLAADRASCAKVLAPVLGRPKFKLATVKSLDGFAAAAAELADALIPERR